MLKGNIFCEVREMKPLITNLRARSLIPENLLQEYENLMRCYFDEMPEYPNMTPLEYIEANGSKSLNIWLKQRKSRRLENYKKGVIED